MNKLFDHPAKIFSWVSLIILLSGVAYTAIDTSKKAEANDRRIYKVEEYISEQQSYTKALNKMMEQNQQRIYEPYQDQRQQAPSPSKNNVIFFLEPSPNITSGLILKPVAEPVITSVPSDCSMTKILDVCVE